MYPSSCISAPAQSTISSSGLINLKKRLNYHHQLLVVLGDSAFQVLGILHTSSHVIVTVTHCGSGDPYSQRREEIKAQKPQGTLKSHMAGVGPGQI